MDDIVVWVSAGAASAAALRKTVDLYGGMANIRAVYNPVKEEHHDNLRFLKDIEKWCGVKVELAENYLFPDNSAETVWRKRGYMVGIHGAPCTEQLKKEARRQWEDRNAFNGWHVYGFTVGEEHRHMRRVKAGMRVLPVLISEGLTKAACFQLVAAAGLDLPAIYSISSPFGDGFPNANCIGCVKATSATYWNHVRCTFPTIFDGLAKLSRLIGAKLVRCHPKYLSFCSKHADGFWYDDRTNTILHVMKNGKWKLDAPRIYLDELPPDARGRSMKTMKIECGISCGIDD